MNNVIMDSQILTSLMSCPRLCDNRFNKDLTMARGKSNSLECGSLVHIILEFYNKALIEGKTRENSMEIGFKAGKEYLVPYSDYNKYVTEREHPGLLNTPEENEKARTGWSHIFKTMEEYFEYYRNHSWTPIEVENVRRDVIYQDDNLRVMWKAKFDLISDTPAGFLPEDHKTMKQRRDTLSLNNQFMGQCILAKSRSVVIDKIGFQTSLKPHEKFEKVLISYSANRLAEWTNEIVPHYANMLLAYNEADNFPPNFTNCETKYGFCDFKEVCESDVNLREDVIKMHFIKGKKWDI